MILMGVVFPPNPEHNFDGKTTMKHVSRSRQLQRDTYNTTKFYHDYHVNQLLISRDWRHVYNGEMYAMDKILTLIVDYYELNDKVAKALCPSQQ
jgi:hypothetical protein